MDGIAFDGRQVARPARLRATDRMKAPKARRRHRRRLNDAEARLIRAMDWLTKHNGGMATDDIGLVAGYTGQHVRAEIAWFLRRAREAKAAREEEADDPG